jgi:WD40 repeat protein
VGGSINNSLCISRHPRTTDSNGAGEIRLLVCNNDETIKIYSLPSLQRITTIGLPTAVNFASVSPDGRRLCAVGDSNQIFLFDISPSGYYQRIATLNGTSSIFY